MSNYASGSNSGTLGKDNEGNLYLRVGLTPEQIALLTVPQGANTLIENSVNSVTTGTEQIIVTYTVPVGKTFNLHEVAGTSCNRSKFWVEIDGSEVKRKNTYNGDFNIEFEMYGYQLTEGQVVRLKASHSRPSSADLQGSILGLEQ